MHEHELKLHAVVKGEVLIVCTSCDKLGESGPPTGTWLSEVAGPYYIFKDSGFDVTIASVRGGGVPVDPASQKPEAVTPAAQRMLQDAEVQQQLAHSVPLDKVQHAAPYSAIFLPGGHGTMFDLPGNHHLASLLGEAFTQGKVVAAVCHGPAGLLAALGPAGEPIVAGRRVTGFSDTEEAAVNKQDLVPFSLEERLRAAGGKYVRGAGDWEEFAVRDGQLVTGQNPASSERVASLVVEVLTAPAGSMPEHQ